MEILARAATIALCPSPVIATAEKYFQSDETICQSIN